MIKEDQMDRNKVLLIQERVRNERFGLDIYYYIESPVLKEVYLECAGALENVFEDEYDGINEVYDINLTEDGVLTFIQHNQVGFSYDTPAFGYTEKTTLEYLIEDLDNYVGGNLSKILSRDNISELIIAGCIGDKGNFADDIDVALIDFYYSKETGFQNLTKFIRYLQYDDTRVEFNSDYEISSLTYSDEFDGEEGILTLQGIELVEVIESWVQDNQRILQIDTLEIKSTVIISFGELFEESLFYLASKSIPANSKIEKIYIDANIQLEDDFIEFEGNQNTVFYIVESNARAISKVQQIGMEIIVISKDEFPTYEGELEE